MATQRTLLLLRHAKSDWSTDRPDARRPLSKRGRRDAPAAGRWLAEHAPPLDLVVCSTAVRARRTWALASAALNPAPNVLRDERLYAATATGLLAVVHALPGAAGAVLLVAHNPGLSDLVELLTGQPRELKTSAIAVLTWPGEWADAAPAGATETAFAAPRG
jgi:phosphohistidine phosphatase